MAKRRLVSSQDLVIFGEFFSDLIFFNLPDRPRYGEETKTNSFLIAPGGLATTALAAARLGSRTAIIARVGEDAATLPTWTDLAAQGLDVSACEISRQHPTALTVCVAYKADRMLVTHEPIHRNLEELLARPAVLRKLRSTRHVHLACALRQPRKWTPILRGLRDEGITISADFGWNPDLAPRDVLSILSFCEFVFPNEHEAKWLTGKTSTVAALHALANHVRVPVITMGNKGAMLLADGSIYREPAMRQAIVDATGAGDAFNGGFLHALLSGYGWQDCLRAGNVCGGLTVAAPGGSSGLPTAGQFHQAMQAGKARPATKRAVILNKAG